MNNLTLIQVSPLPDPEPGRDWFWVTFVPDLGGTTTRVCGWGSTRDDALRQAKKARDVGVAEASGDVWVIDKKTRRDGIAPE